MRKQIFNLLLMSIIVTVTNNSYSQENIDSIYGFNPILYNGQMYSYVVPNTVKGDQYLVNQNFVHGNVNLNGKTFNKLLLNYDTFNQEILLKFKLNHRTIIIKLFKERIKEFTLDDKYFELISNSDSINIIYQVFGKGKYKILQHWQKKLNLSNVSGTSNYEFSKPFKSMYLQVDDQIIKYKNNRTFLSLISALNKAEVKNYLKQNKIKVKKASDQKLNKLTHFCNTL